MSVYRKEDPSTIQALFNSIASRYDLGNSLLAFHMHALWNRSLVSALMLQRPHNRFLDLCAGTGDIAFRALKYAQKRGIPLPEFFLLDFSSEMLQIAEKRIKNLPCAIHDKFHLSQGNAEEIPFAPATFDTVSCAYGIRNVANVESSIKEVYRVLESGGWFGIVELTEPKGRMLSALHALYLRTVVPTLGKLVLGNEAAYQYLSSSIQAFVCPEKIVQLLEKEGFTNVSTKPLAGGIATRILAQKRENS